MPWTCKQCAKTGILDDVKDCPGCGTSKASWTTVPGETLHMQVSQSKKFQLRRATERGVPLSAQQSYDGVETSKAKAAPVVSKAKARALHEAGERPAPGDLLFVRLFPPEGGDRKVSATVLYDMAEPSPVELPAETPPKKLRDDGSVDVVVLCVFGPDPLPDAVTFPGIQIVDVSEETEAGFASQLGVEALGKKRQDLPLELLPVLVEKFDCKQVRFLFDCHVMLPHGLDVVADVYRHLRQHPNRKVLVVGHTDRAGTREHNEPLSGARAHNVASLLRGPSHPFAFAGCDPEREDPKTQQYVAKYPQRPMCPVRPLPIKYRDPTVIEIMRWASVEFRSIAASAFPKFTGPVDWASDVGQLALKSFISGANTLAGGAVALFKPRPVYDVDESTFMAINYYYRARLAEMLGHGRNVSAMAAELKRVKWAFDDQPSLGCGENHPKVKPELDGYKCFDNRRVEILFFPPGEEPGDLTPTQEGPRKVYPIYDESRYTLEPLPCHPPEFGGFPLPEGKHVFLIDVSSSMASQGTNYRINRAKVELNRALFGLAEQTAEGSVTHEFAVLAFSAKGVYSDQEVETTVQYFREGSMLRASWQNQQDAEEWVNGLEPLGATCTYQGMQAALSVTEATHIYLLSDGQPTRDKENQRVGSTAGMQAEVLAIVKAKVAARAAAGDPLTIVTFGFTNAPAGLPEFLTSLATPLTGGKFVPI